MATRKQPTAKKDTAKSSASAKKPKRKISAKMLYTEKHPENHQVSGKFKFFYVLFACTTIFFAALSVWLFCFASEMMNKYQSIDACARTHGSCNVTYDGDNYNVEKNVDE